MSRGKYSPHATGDPFVGVEWKQGTAGYTEVDINGFDWYGYDENGKDAAGYTEEDYLLNEDLWNDECEMNMFCGR